MIGIESIASYLPFGRIDNYTRLEQFGISGEFIEEKTGMRRLAVRAADEETSDMCRAAYVALQAKGEFDPATVDCLVVCTQNPDGKGLPHTSAVVHDKLGLGSHCAAFDISLGCSGYVYSLSVMRAFMEANGMQRGLLFTCDPYSKIVDGSDKNTSLLFGDAATVTLMGAKPAWQLGRFVFGSRGADHRSIHVSGNGRLEMNGRAVFSFSATAVPANIRETLGRNGLDLADVDRFLLHQGSRYIVDTIRKNLDLDEARMPFGAADYGNTVSSSIPLLLETVEPDVRTVLISGFGVGLSWASGVLTRAK